MSTSIDGIYFEHSNIDEILDSVDIIKIDFEKYLKKQFLNDISEYIIKDFIGIFFENKKTDKLIFINNNTRNTLKLEDIKNIEENNLIFWHFLKFQKEAIKKQPEQDFFYNNRNYYFNIFFLRQKFTKLAPKYLGILNTNNSDMKNKILQYDKIKDYSYYDGSDGQVEEIGYKNWIRRGRNWEKLLPSGDFNNDKSLKIEVANTSKIILNINKNQIYDYLKFNINHLFEKEIKEHIINTSYNQYMLKKGLNPININQIKFSEVLLMSQVGKNFEKDNTYTPSDIKEQEFLDIYKESAKIIRKKIDILFSNDLISLINLSLFELNKAKEKINLEKNMENLNNKKERKKQL